MNQFSLSGPRKARAFALNAYFADDGVHTGVDWIFPGFGPLKDALQPMLFADYGYGQRYAILEGDEDTEGEFSNIGLGFRINVAGVRGSLTLAQPLAARNTALEDDSDIEDDVRAYFDLQYSF